MPEQGCVSLCFHQMSMFQHERKLPVGVGQWCCFFFITRPTIAGCQPESQLLIWFLQYLSIMLIFVIFWTFSNHWSSCRCMSLICHIFFNTTHLFSQFIVLGLKVLAVTTPWCVELDQDILTVIVHNGVKVLSYNNLQGDTEKVLLTP